MNKKTYSDEIKLLAANDTKRNQTARLNDLYDDIEAALASGVTRSSIVETLAKNGFEMPLGSFHSALHRIRKQRAKLSAPASNPVAKTVDKLSSPPKVEVKPINSTPIVGSHNPADLDKIRGSFVDLEALANIVKKKKV